MSVRPPSGVETASQPGRCRGWLLGSAALAVEAVVLGLWAARHGVNADEGFYLAAGRYVLEGRHLYRDVFFPQMPYLPFLEAMVFAVVGVSLAAGRALSVAGGAVSAGIVAGMTWRQERSVAVTGAVVLLYVASGVLLNSLAITKTYGVANACLLTAWALLAGGTGRGPLWAFVAGVAVAAAIGVRLAVAPVALVFAFLAWRQGPRALLAFVAGGVIGSLPWLVMAIRHPDYFWFCNVTFHGLRREIAGLSAVLLQKIDVVAKWTLVPQHVVLWLLAALGLWRAPRRVWSAAACVAILAIAYAMATPTYLEYTAQFLPFVLLTAAPGVAALLTRPRFAALVMAVYVLALYPFVRSVPVADELAAKRALWRLSAVSTVAAHLRSHTPPGVPILSWWEGYPVLSDRPGFVGVGFWESNVAKKLAPAEARHYHVLREEDVRAVISRREASAVVVADGMWEQLRADIEAAYVPTHRFGEVQIYTRASR